MLIAITSRTRPASDLGYALHKHPDRVQQFDVGYGKATVFYPVASEDECTFVMVVEVDPVRLARGPEHTRGGGLVTDYVTDRPYAASSMLAVAIGKVLSTATAGRCEKKPELAAKPMDLEVEISTVRNLAQDRVRSLFTDLGYKVEIEGKEQDRYVTVRTRSDRWTLGETLRQIRVLLPAIDGRHHHYVNDEDVAHLLRHGEGWLDSHPQGTWISRRYLARKRSLAEQAVRALEARNESEDEPPWTGPTRESLQRARIDRVTERLVESGARIVADLGCGEGALVRELAKEPAISKVVGIDISANRIEQAKRRLARQLGPSETDKTSLLTGAIGVQDARWSDCDAAALVETIEHIDVERLDMVERNVFGREHLRCIIVTTPNREYNHHYGLEEGQKRHRDHRFEWSREEMREWAQGICQRYGLEASHEGIGEHHPDDGWPTQMAVFTRIEGVRA